MARNRRPAGDGQGAAMVAAPSPGGIEGSKERADLSWLHALSEDGPSSRPRYRQSRPAQRTPTPVGAWSLRDGSWRQKPRRVPEGWQGGRYRPGSPRGPLPPRPTGREATPRAPVRSRPGWRQLAHHCSNRSVEYSGDYLGFHGLRCPEGPTARKAIIGLLQSSLESVPHGRGARRDRGFASPPPAR